MLSRQGRSRRASTVWLSCYRATGQSRPAHAGMDLRADIPARVLVWIKSAYAMCRSASGSCSKLVQAAAQAGDKLAGLT